ncbi:hypothetical protein EDD38_3104 [Kitasatospora cineracea]|uniref:Uncharacterized protein n=1 Tax=Kitasatospora cineracea TaxID=88074 RepID=A0A3N4RMV0_9ACTN|nr:hypothetical protein EDD38_3104 [Kitasatospora cineracea]
MFWNLMIGLFYVGDAALFFGLALRFILSTWRSR